MTTVHVDFSRLRSSDEGIVLQACEALGSWLGGTRSAATKLKYLGNLEEVLTLIHSGLTNFPENFEICSSLTSVLFIFISVSKGWISSFHCRIRP
jgi:hypothetical protein